MLTFHGFVLVIHGDDRKLARTPGSGEPAFFRTRQAAHVLAPQTLAADVVRYAVAPAIVEFHDAGTKYKVDEKLLRWIDRAVETRVE